MEELTRVEIPEPLPPHRLVTRLGPGVHALDAALPGGWGSRPGAANGVRSLLALEPELRVQGGLEALEEARRWLGARASRPPLAALLIGWLSYDLGREFEVLPERAIDDLDLPHVCLSGFRAVYVYEPRSRRGQVVGSAPGAVRRLADRIRAVGRADPAGAAPRLPAPQPRTTDAEFRDGVRAIQDWIRRGDVYQVNLSRRLDFEPTPPQLPALAYERITASSGAPFSAYLDTGSTVVLSNSPERFLRVHGDRIETAPLKGTRPRGRTPEQDRWLAKDLVNSPKDRAEHLMIVDLERNDLGRICHTGSIEVRGLAQLRRFATVFHLVSSVRGRLRSPHDWTGILRATFPGGSISGAPKLRAMQIIDELEPVRRGLYTGALGCFDAAGGLDLSIAIRTALVRQGRLYLHLGSGIVADSDPDSELRETVDKGRAFSGLWESVG